jgi:NAD(P)H-nitrite reductase large subunit
MRILIIGAGPAGLTVAETLREHEDRAGSAEAEAEITMLSAEPFPPYAPPAMADYFLTGREETLFWKGEEICEQLSIDHRKGVRVTTVRPEPGEITLDGGETISYERLVIASGSRLYAPLAGYELPGVYNFKSLSAAKALIEKARRGEVRSALIVGAGFIGVEVALLLSDLGIDVSMVEKEDRIMPRMLDVDLSSFVFAAMRDRGVSMHLESAAEAFAGTREAEGVLLKSGDVARADVYIAATGIKPNVDYLKDSGIDIGWGIRVDEHLRTSSPNVYAGGDVAETYDRLTGERYVHAIFPNAVAQGRVIAENVLGFGTRYEGAESMNSLKHLGVPVVAVGSMNGDEEIRYQRNGTLRKFYLDDGRIQGFRFAGDIRGAGFYHSLMLRGEDVSRFKDKLTDPRFGVADMAFSPPSLFSYPARRESVLH